MASSSSNTRKSLNQTALLTQQSQKRRRAHPSTPRNPARNNILRTTAIALAANPSPRITPHHDDHHDDVLPCDVLDHIFSYMPIRSAVKTSLLSKRFKDSWLFSRNLVFDKDFFRRLSGRTQFVSVVNHICESHAGAEIRLLRVFIDPSGIEQTVHRWIEKSIEKGVKELDLDFDLALEPFRMPFRLMDVPTLTTLKLTYCKVTRLPRDLRGLSSLKTLVLRKAVLEDLTVDSFLFNCVNLETLDLAECYGITRLRVFAVRHRRFKVLKVGYSYELSETRVEAPTLQSLHYCGTIQGLRISVEHDDGESKLRDVMLNFQMARSGVTRSCLVEKLITNILLNVEVLTITSAFLEGLTTRIRDGVYGSIHFWLWNLKELQLYVDSTSYCNLYDISSIVAKCPSIEKLFLDMNDTNFHGGTYWEFHQKPSLEDSPAIFHNLKFLKLRGFKFLNHELELVEYFLKRSPKLESMVLLLPKNGSVDIQPRDAAVCAHLFRIWQANIPEAQVRVCEHRSDESPSPKHSRVWY